jgi:hypothetical protein
MGLISGMMMGVIVGVAIMAGWSRVMRRRSTKRIAKVSWLGLCRCEQTVISLAPFSLHRGVGSFNSGLTVRLGLCRI